MATMEMMGTTWGQHRVETMETTGMGTTWRPYGGSGDHMGMMGTTWG